MVDREMLAAMEELLDRKLDEKLDEKLDQKFSENLKPINDRLERLEAGMEELGKQVSKLKVQMGKLEGQMGKLDGRVAQLEADMTYVKVRQLENNVIRRLNTIEKYYIDTSERYVERTDQIDRMDSDISILKCVVTKHSELLKKVQ